MPEINGYGTTTTPPTQKPIESKGVDSVSRRDSSQQTNPREGVEVVLSSDQEQYTETYENLKQSSSRQSSSAEQRALEDLEYERRTSGDENVETNEVADRA